MNNEGQAKAKMKAKKGALCARSRQRNIVVGILQSAHLFFIRGHDRDAVFLAEWGAESCAENEKLRQKGKQGPQTKMG